MTHYYLLFFIGLYLIATVATGYWASRFVKNTRDFAIAGRQMSIWIVASGLFATWFGSETVMGASAEFVEKGLLGIIEDPFGAALCLFLIGIFMARPLYKLNLLTFSNYFKQRYSKTAETLSAVMMIPSYIGWIAAQLIALATILHVVSGLPIHIGVAVCGVLVMFYTYIGGMWAVSITDFIQTLVIIIGMLLLLADMLLRVGGFSALWANTPEGFFRILPTENSPLAWLEYLAAWITVGLGSIPQQDVFQRVMSARSEKTAVRAAYLSGFMYLTIAFIPLLIALGGKTLYPELWNANNPEQNQMLVPQMVLQHSPFWLQVVFLGALLSAILSTASGAILAPATVVGENIIKPYYKDLSDAQELRLMRLSVIGITIGSIVMTWFNTGIYELVSQSSRISLVSLFTPLVFGLYWKKAHAYGAVASMLVGLLGWLIGENYAEHVPALYYGLIPSIFAMLLGSWYGHWTQFSLKNDK